MDNRIYNVLFLCTGNSARSILAEAIMNNLPISRGRFRAFSAGSHPKGKPHALAIQLLNKNGIATESLRSKSWDEFTGPAAPELDFVFTVCDKAAGEQCPLWPGQPITAHWGCSDPVEVEGDDEKKRRAFTETYMILRRRIDLFTNLPLHSIDRMALERRVKEIGKE